MADLALRSARQETEEEGKVIRMKNDVKVKINWVAVAIFVVTTTFATGIIVQQVRSNTSRVSGGVTHDQLKAEFAERDTALVEMMRQIDAGFSDLRLAITRHHPSNGGRRPK